MSTSTNKSLWTLISGSVMQTNPEVLDDEIESSKELISNGLLYYNPNTPESAKKYASSKASSENIRNLVNKLSKLLGVEESICSDILCSYLVTEFRGTMESLKVLLKEEQNTKPLLLDIWQYYRAERLYLLQIIKHVLAGQSDYNDDSDLDLSKMAKLLDSGQMNKLLLDQINSVTKEKKPNTEGLGTGLGKNCSALWVHFNLREISELLQILLLSLSVNGFDKTDIINITDAFYQFGFGNKLSMKMEFNESNSQLVKSISYLSIMNLVYLLDLPTLTVSTEDHKIWGDAETVTKMERLISGLGSSPLDSPALLTWTLSCYLAKGSEGLGKSTRMGEVAVANRVLKHFENILSADFMHHSVVADIIHMQVFSVLSVLLTVFDPTSMGMDFDLASLAVSLLKHEPAAEQLWSQEPDTGLRLFVTEQLQNFPNNFLTVVDTMTSLASGCQLSCCNIVASLASLHLYSERVDGINIRIGENADGTVQLLEDRYPYMSTKSIHIPAGTRGELLESGCVRWRMKINGWQILLAECSELNMELLTGEEQIKTERLNRVTRIANLVANILKVCPEKSKVLDGIINELEIVCGRLCQVAQPPVHLLAGILQTLAYLAKADGPSRPVASLAATGLLPHFSLSHSLLVKSSATLDPGLVGHLLAGEETVSGDYPLLLAFLNFMKETCQTKESLSGILLICREILPGLSNWRYQNPGDREHILKLSLATLLAFINNVKEGCELLAPETNVTTALLNLISTGDRTIQTMLEGQVSWEKGRGTDFCQIIHYALQILHRKLINLLISPASSLILSGPVGVALRSPPSGHQPHLVLSLAQYTFFFHDPLLVTAAVNMLAAIARAAAVAEESVSMLACLGNSAVSVKERLVNRLESSLEDIRLKIAIVNLLSECIVGQPGMIQLLLDININIVVSESKVTDKEHSKPQLIGEGCLEPALGLLALCKERKGDNWDKLHLSLVKLIYRLWDSASLLATRHLKDTPEFWMNLCWPLYDVRKDSGLGHTELKAYILRILASEVYTWKGKVAPELNKVLEKICNEKSDSMKTWCNGSITESGMD